MPLPFSASGGHLRSLAPGPFLLPSSRSHDDDIKGSCATEAHPPSQDPRFIHIFKALLPLEVNTLRLQAPGHW